MRHSVSSILIGLALLAPMAGHAQLLTDFDGNGAVPTGTIFRQPTFSGSTGALLQPTPDSTTISTDHAQSGANSDKVEFAFLSTATNPWLRLTTSGTNPVISLNATLTMSVLIVPASPTAAGDNSLGFTLGVRETNHAGPFGTNSLGAPGGIEYVGASSKNGSAPVGINVTADGLWHDINFVMTGNGMALATTGLTGNGTLDTSTGFGTFEGLYLNPIASTGQAYTVYIDDIRQTPATGGAIPEPGSMALLATGIVPLLGLRRRKA
jgi:hypothetical protein